MATLHVLRVFTGEDGGHGNPLGVFLEGSRVPDERRQSLAAELGFSETVFVEDARRGTFRIFTPASELPFAGHPSVGTAWLLAHEGEAVKTLRPPAGEVPVRREGGLTFVAARAEWCPPWELVRCAEPAEVDALQAAPDDRGMAYCWAWEDEAGGTVRARCFAPDEGVAEDEATGSGAIALCAELQRPLTIHQGRGSILHAAPLAPGRAEVGGKVTLDEVRDHVL
jgi:predicted PhzF superfamily epimerase YddE/YHI9